jgi:hypothetical protein
MAIKFVKPREIDVPQVDDVSVILSLTIILLCILIGVVSLGPIALSYYQSYRETLSPPCGQNMSSKQVSNFASGDKTNRLISC